MNDVVEFSSLREKAGPANRNLKDRLVLRDGQEPDKLNICMNRLSVWGVL